MIGSSNFQLHCGWAHFYRLFLKCNLEQNMRESQFHTAFIGEHKETQFISSDSQMKTHNVKMAGPHMCNCLLHSTWPPQSPLTRHFSVDDSLSWRIRTKVSLLSNSSTVRVRRKGPLKCPLISVCVFMCVQERDREVERQTDGETVRERGWCVCVHVGHN